MQKLLCWMGFLNLLVYLCLMFQFQKLSEYTFSIKEKATSILYQKTFFYDLQEFGNEISQKQRMATN